MTQHEPIRMALRRLFERCLRDGYLLDPTESCTSGVAEQWHFPSSRGCPSCGVGGHIHYVTPASVVLNNRDEPAIEMHGEAYCGVCTIGGPVKTLPYRRP
jgi:hypothetical protein